MSGMPGSRKSYRRRTSEAHIFDVEMSADSSAAETPYTHLRQLAGAIRRPSTPSRQAPPTTAAAAASTRHGVGSTPASGSRTPALNRPPRPIPGKRSAPTTPHAIRALQQRRAAAMDTPGRERRRSGRQQRQTPRDVLRQLSRIEAPKTRPAQSSPDAMQEDDQETGSNEDESDADFARPNTTLLADDDDDDDSFQAPPRLSRAMEEETQTQVSIEGPRRDFTTEAARLVREGVRASDRFADIDNMEFEDNTQPRDTFSPDDSRYDLARGNLHEADTEDLQPTLADRSGFAHDNSQPVHGLEENDSTFAFDIPDDLQEEDEEGKEERDVDPSEQQNQVDAELVPPTFDLAMDSPNLKKARPSKREPKVLKKSRYGISYPEMPAGVVKRITTSLLRSSGNGKTKVSPDILAAVLQASDWFFEQLGDDLGAYAEHARKKTVDETDIITLMKRQRLLNAASTPFSLAQRHLPAELLQGIRMTLPAKTPARGKEALGVIPEEGEDD